MRRTYQPKAKPQTIDIKFTFEVEHLCRVLEVEDSNQSPMIALIQRLKFSKDQHANISRALMQAMLDEVQTADWVAAH